MVRPKDHEPAQVQSKNVDHNCLSAEWNASSGCEDAICYSVASDLQFPKPVGSGLKYSKCSSESAALPAPVQAIRKNAQHKLTECGHEPLVYVSSAFWKTGVTCEVCRMTRALAKSATYWKDQLAYGRPSRIYTIS